MRIIIQGDKSRYQFLRSIVPDVSEGMDLSTESLGRRNIRIVSEREAQGENCIYSPALPLHTELYFPGELELEKGTSDAEEAFDRNDKILLFDEFPYRTQEEAALLESFRGKGNVEVILVHNKRKAMDSDLTSESESLEAVYNQYIRENIPVEVFNWEDDNQFLFWNHMGEQKSYNERFREKLEAVYERIQRRFNLIYELCKLTEGLYGILNNPGVLEDFVKYDNTLRGKDVYQIYSRRAYQYFWEQKKTLMTKMVQNTMDKILAEEKEICLWDMEQSVSQIVLSLSEAFTTSLKMDKTLVFQGGKDEYQSFLNHNKELIDEFKHKIILFFNEEMRDIMKDRLVKQLKTMEDIINEKIS